MKRVALFLTFVIMVNLLVPSVAMAQQENDWKVIMYALDGRTIEVWASEADAYAQVGWYYTPMTRLYADGGKSCVVPTQSVSMYRAVGWRPLHAYVMDSSYANINAQFGPMQYFYYYGGTPNSGDLNRAYYKNAEYGYVPHMTVGIWPNRDICVVATFKLKDVFPYLWLYADENGMVNKATLEYVLGNNGMYGRGYRSTEPGDIFECFTNFYDDKEYNAYSFDYDYIGVTIKHEWNGLVNLNTAECAFSSLL